MSKHPAFQAAETVMYAAGELRGYIDPEAPVPRELTDDDHLVLLPRLRAAIWDIAAYIEGIATATPDEWVRQKLTESAKDLRAGCDWIQDVEWGPEEPGAEPAAMTQPAALAASSFPQPIIGATLQAATRTPASPAAGPAAAPRPDESARGQAR